MSNSTSFDRAAEALKLTISSLKGVEKFQENILSDRVKLQVYALFKQASVGPINTSQPSFWNVVDRAKWDAWNSIKEMSNQEAGEKYVDLVLEQLNLISNCDLADYLKSLSSSDKQVAESFVQQIETLAKSIRATKKTSIEVDTNVHGKHHEDLKSVASEEGSIALQTLLDRVDLLENRIQQQEKIGKMVILIGSAFFVASKVFKFLSKK